MSGAGEKEAESRTWKTISTRKNLNLILRIRNFPLRKADAWKAGTLSLGGEVKFYGALQLCPTSPHPQLFLRVIGFSCSFKLGWSWIVSVQVSPRPSSSCVWKPSEKVKGSINRALSAPTIHSYVPGLQRPLFWAVTWGEKEGHLLNVLIIVVPTLKCSHSLPKEEQAVI